MCACCVCVCVGGGEGQVISIGEWYGCTSGFPYFPPTTTLDSFALNEAASLMYRCSEFS